MIELNIADSVKKPAKAVAKEANNKGDIRVVKVTAVSAFMTIAL